jgi:hypothetical protein
MYIQIRFFSASVITDSAPSPRPRHTPSASGLTLHFDLYTYPSAIMATDKFNDFQDIYQSTFEDFEQRSADDGRTLKHFSADGEAAVFLSRDGGASIHDSVRATAKMMGRVLKLVNQSAARLSDLAWDDAGP